MLASLAQSASSSDGGVALFVPLLLALGLGFIPANIAKKKGYSAGGFYVFGVLFFLIALIVAVCLRNKTLTSSTVPASPSPLSRPAMPPPPAPTGGAEAWSSGPPP
jgi:hypothetical protein